jgi:hypothetical protein
MNVLKLKKEGCSKILMDNRMFFSPNIEGSYDVFTPREIKNRKWYWRLLKYLS